jgi:hypothetical protein
MLKLSLLLIFVLIHNAVSLFDFVNKCVPLYWHPGLFLLDGNWFRLGNCLFWFTEPQKVVN